MKEWKLLILNTAYKGAEINFTHSQRLGSDENSMDLVLNDSDIPPHLLSLNCQDDAVYCEPFAQTVGVKVQGVLHDNTLALPTLTPINVGELWFMIGEVNEPWPKKLPVFDKPSVNQSKSEQPVKMNKTYKHLSNLIWLAVLGTITAAVLLFLDIKAETGQEVDTEKLNLSIAKDLLQTDSRPHLIIDWDEVDQKISLSGYVDSKLERKKLLKQAEKLNIRFTSDIRTMEEIKFAARFILKNLELDAIEMRSGDLAGSLVFVTDSNNLNAWSRAEQVLQRDIPGLTAFDLEILEDKPALEQLNELLVNSSFNDKIIVEDRGDIIELVGQLSGSQLREFDQLKKQFATKFGNNPRLILSTPMIKQDDSPNLSLRFRTVNLGKVPYIVLDNGERYFEGARLPNGARLKSISSEGVFLESGNKSYMINFSRTI
ncbi:type III secretion system inner membrane ring subunit SctD [Pseudoalteromonas sp. MMG024]|uniref:type III secretion system inner membrane ring subunit SctD n=1 Tax=Pseudoalteromonas sp. MMG024 TaxID=2909980 RepID=UPI0031B9FAFE|nr:type III secretion system inner membrane ring subunit SctD [Pseudoalteromonas sp. MMG024]